MVLFYFYFENWDGDLIELHSLIGLINRLLNLSI